MENKSLGGRNGQPNKPHLPRSYPTTPGYSTTDSDVSQNLRISPALSCLAKTLKTDDKLKDCRIINTCQYGTEKIDLVKDT